MSGSEVSFGHAIPLLSVLYVVAGFMVLAVVFALIALFFSRRALYLAVLYVPTCIYAYYALTA